MDRDGGDSLAGSAPAEDVQVELERLDYFAFTEFLGRLPKHATGECLQCLSWVWKRHCHVGLARVDILDRVDHRAAYDRATAWFNGLVSVYAVIECHSLPRGRLADQSGVALDDSR